MSRTVGEAFVTQCQFVYPRTTALHVHAVTVYTLSIHPGRTLGRGRLDLKVCRCQRLVQTRRMHGKLRSLSSQHHSFKVENPVDCIYWTRANRAVQRSRIAFRGVVERVVGVRYRPVYLVLPGPPHAAVVDTHGRRPAPAIRPLTLVPIRRSSSSTEVIYDLDSHNRRRSKSGYPAYAVNRTAAIVKFQICCTGSISSGFNAEAIPRRLVRQAIVKTDGRGRGVCRYIRPRAVAGNQ